MIFITEGEIFDESESQSETVDSSIPTRIVSKPDDSSVHVESSNSAESLLNSMISDFNNMNSFPYDLGIISTSSLPFLLIAIINLKINN